MAPNLEPGIEHRLRAAIDPQLTQRVVMLALAERAAPSRGGCRRQCQRRVDSTRRHDGVIVQVVAETDRYRASHERLAVELTNRNVLVTGATSGIGNQLARQLAARGNRVFACGRDPERLAELRTVDGIEVITAELSTAADRTRLLDDVTRRGGVDIVVNNAGVQNLVDAHRPPAWDAIERELAVNLAAPIHLVHLFLPQIIERSSAQRPGAIVNITSGLALAPKASAAPYCAAKAGLRAYTTALRWQLRDDPVLVIEALPPLVKTPMTAGRNDDGISADDCAAAIVRGLENDRRQIYVGKSALLRKVMRVSPRLGEKIMRDS